MDKSTKSTHLISILEDLLNNKTLASLDIKASNANQYFCTIKNNGIELIEVSVPNLMTRGNHLERRLNPTGQNTDKAKVYLNMLKGLSLEEKK